MDFYKCINSKAVSEYLREIKFELNSLQCLWIIFQNEKITLDEKVEALKYILNMPDHEFKSFKFPAGTSVHRLINSYFDYINTIEVELKSKDENCFYSSYIHYENGTSHPGIYFKDYETCYRHIKDNYLNDERTAKTKDNDGKNFYKIILSNLEKIDITESDFVKYICDDIYDYEKPTKFVDTLRQLLS